MLHYITFTEFLFLVSDVGSYYIDFILCLHPILLHTYLSRYEVKIFEKDVYSLPLILHTACWISNL